ncbi:BTAD domain-containing putative transcriptional regulator [Amycolatopsis umgeniensis]|uniref:DNA-binding SARP family transcriptional activator n=1 Tax=Amycolatopsis umgeniensis TaxID=336628 RepID=A0A841BC53_9PSEU|nr:BTAD domain-containing putative transcriptional regulator [Amycolatopsis umgeniensis]MBB5856415.1 DNA-binding SARP family transcriptional activator [Amycolatopsis umgeniensis]
MPGRAPLTRTARLLGRVTRGLFAAVVLTALMAGLPWALISGVGWPLPERLPGLDEIGSVLMTQMSPRFLLDTLACLAWLLWLVFVLDLAACAADVARGARLPDLKRQTGPVRRVTAVLVGALLVAVLDRTAPAAPLTPADAAHPAGHAQVAVTATGATTSVAHEQPRLPAAPGTERVRPPENGVHDSLWRIAQRCLGDGDRWPEIWALNHGSAQPGERTLTNPNRIHPGDTLHLPATSPPSGSPASPPPESVLSAPAPGSTPPTPITVTPAPSKPASAAAPSVATATDRPAGGAVSWGSGEVFVSLGLAAAVSAVLVLARRRRHARYRPGSGRRDDDLPVAPVVYQLRLAHLRAQHHDEDLELDIETDSATGDPASREHREPGGEDPVSRSSTAPAGPDNEGPLTMLIPRVRRVIGAATPVGRVAGPATLPSVVDVALDTAPQATDGEAPMAGEGIQVALDLARVHGLGLLGPGGYAAARALLLTLLATSAENVYVPSADVARLLGVPVAATDLPESITVVADLDTAMAALETPAPPRPTVLITSPPGDPSQQARLQHLLDNNAQHGITALLLGQWRAGVTAYVTGGGIISATDPGLGEPLRGKRAFTLPETATRDLLAFLRTAAPHDSAGIDDPLRGTPGPRQTATTQGTTFPGPSVGDPRRLEITAGPPAPEPSPASEPGEEPRPHATGTEPSPPAPLALAVFGAPVLHWRSRPGQAEGELRDLTGELSSRPLELLVFLAVHPGGVPRDAIVDALWPDDPPRNPASVLRTVLSRIRRALDTATHGTVGELILAEHGQYRLDPAVVEADYWSFADAVTRRRRAGTAERRAEGYEAIVAHYGGVLADGLDADWLTATREATRRDALDAVAALARARVGTDPDYTLDLLETARAFDPHNELIYRDIMRLQHALGRHDAISRTLNLLRTRLTEIDTTPTADTVDLVERLRARSTGIPVEDLSRVTAP